MKKQFYLLLVLFSVLLGACSSSDNDKVVNPQELTSEQITAKLQGRWKSIEDDTTWFYQFINDKEGYRFKIAKEMDSSDLIQPFDYSYQHNVSNISLKIWEKGRPDEYYTPQTTNVNLDLEEISESHLLLNIDGSQVKWQRSNIGSFKSIIGKWNEDIESNDPDPEITTLTFNQGNTGIETMSYKEFTDEFRLEYHINTKLGFLTYEMFYEDNDSESNFFIILDLTDTKLHLLSNEGSESYTKISK